MKFLVDAQLPRRLARLLKAANHDAMHTLDLPRRNLTPDDELIDVCAQENRILVIKDLEFADSFLLKRAPARLLLVSTGNIANKELEALFLRTHLINRNGCVARDMVLLQGARRENILYGSSTDEQRRSRAKDRATLRAEFWRAAGRVAPQSQSAMAMLFRRALPAARQNSAHPVPIYEIGSTHLPKIAEAFDSCPFVELDRSGMTTHA
jgi:predicted nuclease of predicted toxin-antitoxin system